MAENINYFEQLKKLQKERDEIDKKIELVTKKIQEQNSSLFQNIKVNVNNKELFSYYLSENKSLKDSSINSYFDTLDTMKQLLEDYCDLHIPTQFYYIDDIDVFNKIIEIFKSNSDLTMLNLKWHHIVSAAYNNYYKFLCSIKDFD